MSEGLKWTTPNALLDEDADVAKIQVSLAKIVTYYRRWVQSLTEFAVVKYIMNRKYICELGTSSILAIRR